jgi:hypothetical protein
MRNIITSVFLLLFALTVSAQKSNIVLVAGNAGDTLLQSATLSKVADITSKDDVKVSVQVYIDKLTGTPRCGVTLYESIDGEYFVSTGVTANYAGTADTTFILTDTGFAGNYLKAVITTTSSAGKAKYKVNAKTSIK